MRQRKFIALFLIILLGLTLSFSGCGANKAANGVKMTSTSQAPSADGSVGFNNQAENRNIVSEQVQENSTLDSGRKIIKSAYIIMETNDFDQATTTIITKTNSLGGYIESSNITGRRLNNQGTVINRRANFKLRIPELKLTGFILDINNLGNVINNETKGDDITSQYFDTEARLKSLKIREERLLEILKKAAKIEDVITLEKELSNVRYEIENFTGTLNKWDNLVSFATLDMEIMEVQELLEIKNAPISLSERMASSFNNSVKLLTELSKGFLIIIVALLPFSIVIIPLGLVILYILRLKGKKENLKQ